MKNPFTFLVSAAAGLLLLAAPVSAADATAWTQLGFTIELSSGTLNIAPFGTFNEASAYWNPGGSTLTTALDGYAFANMGSSTAISTSLNADNYFLIDAFAQVSGVSNGGGASAAATALAFYDLSFSNVAGSTVDVTLTPAFYASTLSDTGGSFSYVSAFLSLGSESFFSFQDSNSNAGWAEFGPITLTVGAGDTIGLNAALSAGVAVPEASSILYSLSALALMGLIATRRQLARRRIAV